MMLRGRNRNKDGGPVAKQTLFLWLTYCYWFFWLLIIASSSSTTASVLAVDVVPDDAVITQSGLKDQFGAALDTAVRSGELGNDLPAGSVERILSSLAPTSAPTRPPGSSKGLSSGATAGIVLGSAAFILVTILLYALVRRPIERQDGNNDELYRPMGITSTDSAGGERDNATSAGGSTDAAVASVGAIGTLGAKQADYGKNKGKTSVVAYDTLEAGAAASAIPRVVDKSEASSVPSMPSVTRADLDTAIEAGDWAAVGATAALLAAASDSQEKNAIILLPQ